MLPLPPRCIITNLAIQFSRRKKNFNCWHTTKNDKRNQLQNINFNKNRHIKFLYDLSIKFTKYIFDISNLLHNSSFFLKVGEQLISNFFKRRQCTLQCEGRTALLTLWGQKSDDEIIPGVYEVYAVRPTNDFNGQRSYNSTPSTAFKVTA